MISPAEYLQSELAKARQAQAEASSRFNTLAIARLIAFGLIFLFCWAFSVTDQSPALLAAFVALVVFVVLMGRQQQVRRERDFQTNLVTIYEDELARLSFIFKNEDNGLHHLEKNHAFAADLDIFGEYSLYKLLNRTHTAEGSRRLANWLKNHANPTEIRLRQAAARDFSQHPELIASWGATALLHKKAAGEVNAFRGWALEKLPGSLTRWMILRWYPLVTLIIAVLALFGIVSATLLVLSLAVHLVILRTFQGYLSDLANRTTSLGKTLSAYSDLLKTAESAPYQSAWWSERKASIENSSAALSRAGALFARLDYRNNAYFLLFVAIPTLFDIHILKQLEDWKATYHSKITDWLNVLADTEAMNSLAGHAFANPGAIMPEVNTQEQVSISATEMGHPLIPGEKRISNDFTLQGTGSTMLITGSNMSGKSTFLRTIGLNLVLAQTGAVVAATSFSFTPVRVFSSMRTQDSLEESTSSFYAELKRSKQLLDLSEEQQQSPVFYLLDEILKGTNSADRHKGAEALIRQLHKRNASGLVSTHDLELGQWGVLENYVFNFHFTSDMENGKLHFDYKLHEGICRSFNAAELMRMMGIEIDLSDKNTAA